MTQTKINKTALALAFIALLFFAIGFASGINSYLVPALESALSLSPSLSYLIIAATFIPFLIFGYPTAAVISRIGYKNTMALAFAIYATGFGCFLFSSSHASFPLFVCASFICGTGNAFLQASVNPYVTLLGPIDSAARRISIMGICNKLAWPVSPVFLAFLINKDVAQTQPGDLALPFTIIIAMYIILGGCALMVKLPKVTAQGEQDSGTRCDYAEGKTSIWQFPHLVFGAIALFFYVGVETIALTTCVDYAATMGLPKAENYGWMSSIGLVAGYICSIALIPRFISQQKALFVCSWISIIASIMLVTLPGGVSIWAIAPLAFGCSIMWAAIWPLALVDLGQFTKKGSALLVMAIAGGAVMPSLFGVLKSAVGMQNAYWIALPCFIIILLYGQWGYKIRTTQH